MKIKVYKFAEVYLNGNGYGIDSWIESGWTPHFPVQATNDRGKIEYHLTLTKETK